MDTSYCNVFVYNYSMRSNIIIHLRLQAKHYIVILKLVSESDYVLAQCGSGRCRTRGSIMDDKGHITFVSGNFFVPNMNFTTTIVTSHKSKVRISFEHFKMYGDQNNCLQKMDYMQIFDGTSTNAKVLTAPLCGTQ